ncbi:tRNA (adenosine(37)-N6)-dimethylallyltransferase MiaA [bacterium]|nr:tRNA (adenosine(37)-N6)-dimethylallyltransferase MiaA [bacterium]
MAPGTACPALVGPTAVGKTALVTALARRVPLEVISLDSRQVYHGLRIGTAQPTSAERAVCPHHLIDFLSPRATYDAQRFRADFVRVHGEITARGGVPILVGGTGLYLTGLREGFMTIPGHSPASLAAVRAELEPLPADEIRRRLAAADPASHARIHPNDRYRSQRALEIFLVSGRTMTDLTASQEPDPALGLTFPAFVLARPVPDLDARIAARTAAMLGSGWIEETEAALTAHADDSPGLQTIGYREIVAWKRGELARDDLAPAIVLATRQYAKRQRTMFRHLAREGTWSPDDPALLGRLVARLGGST